MKRLMVALALVLPAPARAQDAVLAFDGLTFGTSDRAAVEAVYGATLTCAPVSEKTERCRAIGHVRRIEVVLADGVLRQLRMILPAGTIPEAVVADLRTRWGPVLYQDAGRTSGLRVWVYALPPAGLGVLEEVRSRISGTQRLRLAIVDSRGDWLN